MRQLDHVLRKVAGKDIVVTLTGESGTGKEVLARRVHELSHHRSGPFVPINCAAIPETLFESELFGHERGAFTGATERSRGKIEAASGGTLFLDEIGETPLGAQAKLLRFLEQRKFTRVGGATKISVDVRIVTATLRPIEEDVRAGRFRADLFYRIQGLTLHVPPLRDRIDDVVPLVHQFARERSARHGISPPRFTRAALAALCRYSWPGNVRELRNAVELVCVLRAGREVRTRDLPEAVQEAARSATAADREPSLVGDRPEVIEVRLDESLEVTVGRVFAAALALEGGNRSRAARRLCVSLRTMQRHAAKDGRA